MAQKVNKMGVLQNFGKILQEFVEFIVGPWLHRASVKSLQKRIDYLERRIYETLPNTEQHLESLIEQLQEHFDYQQSTTKNNQDHLVEYNLRPQVLEVLKEQTHFIIQTIKPTVENLIRELEDKKRTEANTSLVDIQAKQHKLQASLTQIQQLTASLPQLEAQTAACLEAGHWLLAHREKLAQEVAEEILSWQHSQLEVFRYNLSRYFKLIGSCLENGIEPHLLYQGIITHNQPPVEMYLNAFKLIQDRYISDWEYSDQVSTKASEELRKYFTYLINYLVKIATSNQAAITSI